MRVVSALSRQCIVALGLGCALLLAVTAAVALDPASARFRRLDSSAGLSQDSIQAMLQDDNGWIWLGTQDGLNRFDGYDVTVYRANADQPGSLGSSWVAALALDGEHRLWVGTSAGLFRYDADSDLFQPMPLARNEGNATARGFVYALHVDAGGRLWVGSDSGLSLRTPGHDDAQPLPTWSWPSLTAAGPRRVRSIASGADGGLWLGAEDGLWRFDPATESLQAADVGLGLGSQPVNAVLVDREGGLWIGTDLAGLVHLDPALDQPLRLNTQSDPAIAQNRIHALFQSADDAIWLGTEAGAYRLRHDPQRQIELQAYHHRPHDPTSAGVGRVTSFLASRDGSFWVGSWEGGAARLNDRFSRFLSFNPDMAATAAMQDMRVQTIAAEGDWLWLGSSRGVYRFDTRQHRLETIPALRDTLTFALALAPEAAWIGTGEGLLRFDRLREQVEPIRHIAGIEGARVRRLMLDGDRLWLFAELHGVYVLHLPELSVEAVHSFSGNVVNFAVLDDATVGLSAADGVHLFSRDGRHRLRSLPSNQGGRAGTLPTMPSGMLADAGGRHWVGGYGSGLLQVELPEALDQPAQVRNIAAYPALANNGVNSILRDRQHRLWLATDRGISMFSPEDGRTVNFDADDGALARGYYFSAAVAMDNGLLALGSKHGFTVFDPGSLQDPPPPPAPQITGLERDGAMVAPAGQDPDSPLPAPVHRLHEVQLPPGWGHSLALRFASADYVSAGKLRYRYRLEGFDSRWLEVGADRRLASYTNLGPGNYRFRVLALDPLGRESEERSLAITLLPHWWQTWWAHTAAALALLALAVSAVRLRTRQLRRQSERLERTVSERTQALSAAKQQAETALGQLQSAQQELIRAEKLSALGQLVAGVAHEVNTPLGVALTASSHLGDSVMTLKRRLDEGKLSRNEFVQFIGEAREGSDIIQRNLDRAADLIRNFKQVSVDRSADGRRVFNLQQTLQELTQSMRLLWKTLPIQLQIECPPDIVMDSFPGVLGQVITNLAQNAVNHAFPDGSAGRMTITVQRLDQSRIELRFADDGRGIAAEHLPRIFEPFFTTRRHAGGTGLGLHIVHNLVSGKLGGSIDVSSRLGQGTEFVLRLPLESPATG